jgi:hypothetical protein
MDWTQGEKMQDKPLYLQEFKDIYQKETIL